MNQQQAELKEMLDSFKPEKGNYRQENFINELGDRLVVLTNIDDESKKLYGTIVPLPTPEGVMSVHIGVVGATSVGDAFTKLPTLVESYSKKLEVLMQKPKIVVPGNQDALKTL